MLPCFGICVNLDVDVFDAEYFHKEVAQVECFCCTCVDGVELGFRAGGSATVSCVLLP